MNKLNYASLSASKKLVDNWIVLETEKTWFFSNTGWEMVDRYAAHHVNRHYLPAPSMAEVWRELPEWTECKNNGGGETKCVVMTKNDIKVFFNSNPTDALIDLLVWLKGAGK